MPMDCRWVYMTAETPEEARKLGKALVEHRLAACVNIIEGMTSIFWWEGRVQDGAETVLIAKTTEALVPALIEKVKSLHSYACPCVVALPIVDGNPEFLDWIRSETSPAAD